MTGRTHDLAAFTALSLIVATQDIPQMSLATAFIAFSANMVGGLAPDIDQSTGALWKKVRMGGYLGKLVSPVFGGHRHISHSVIGIVIFGVVAGFLLEVISNVLIVDMNIVWWSFMIGVVSHLIADTFTHSGVPWLLPIPLKLGIPPFKALRFHTGSIVEKGVVFPGLIILNLWIFYFYHKSIIEFIKSII
jgi:inner membrane protein